MNFDVFCAEYWREKSSDRKNDTYEADLSMLIKKYQTDTLRHDEKNELLKRVICKNSKIRKIWTDVRKFVFNHIRAFYCGNQNMAESSYRQMMDCCSVVIRLNVGNCLKKFDTERLNIRDNLNIFSLLTGFIAQSIHYRNVVKDIGLENLNNRLEICNIDRFETEDDDASSEIFIVGNELNPEQEVILNDLLKKIMADLEVSPQPVKFSDFVNESISGSSVLSDKARQQKKRLRNFLKKQWELNNSCTDEIIERIIEFLISRKKI